MFYGHLANTAPDTKWSCVANAIALLRQPWRSDSGGLFPASPKPPFRSVVAPDPFFEMPAAWVPPPWPAELPRPRKAPHAGCSPLRLCGPFVPAWTRQADSRCHPPFILAWCGSRFGESIWLASPSRWGPTSRVAPFRSGTSYLLMLTFAAKSAWCRIFCALTLRAGCDSLRITATRLQCAKPDSPSKRFTPNRHEPPRCMPRRISAARRIRPTDYISVRNSASSHIPSAPNASSLSSAAYQAIATARRHTPIQFKSRLQS